MNRRPHDPDTKAQAKALYQADGAKLASEVTGIPRRTLRRWAMAEQWPRPGDGHRPELRVAPEAETRQPAANHPTATSPAPGRVVAMGYGYQRRVLLRRLPELATLALDQVETELAAGHTAKARDCAVVVGITLDKAEALAKAAGPDQAGGRPDAAEAVARIREMAAELTARRTGSDA